MAEVPHRIVRAESDLPFNPTLGDDVARAKRTDRAEARRKYRAYVEAQAQAGIEEDEGSDSSAGSGRKPARRVPQGTAPLQPGARMGIVQAAKAAYRTPHYIDDIKSIRQLVFKSHAVWPILVLVAASVAYMAPRLAEYSSDSIQQTIFQFVFYPPLLPAMVAGFFAPRESWLAGLIASFIATVGLLVVLFVGGQTVLQVTGGNASASPSSSASEATSIAASSIATVSTSPTSLATFALMPIPSPSVIASTSSVPATVAPTATSVPSASPAAPSAAASPSASPSGSTTTSGGSSGVVGLLSYGFFPLLQSLILGALIGGLSAWYKRFLSLTSGPRKPSSKSGGSRPAQRRRPATRK
jgi:hypothetical protein